MERDAPTHYFFGEHVEYDCDVAEALRQRYVGDVGNPLVIRICGSDVHNEVGEGAQLVMAVSGAWFERSLLLLESGLLHQAHDFLVVVDFALSFEFLGNFAIAVAGRDGEYGFNL